MVNPCGGIVIHVKKVGIREKKGKRFCWILMFFVAPGISFSADWSTWGVVKCGMIYNASCCTFCRLASQRIRISLLRERVGKPCSCFLSGENFKNFIIVLL